MSQALPEDVPEDVHVYLRSISADERSSLSVLAALVEPGASVLDLGCGSGALGQFLARSGCVSDGVTLSPAEAGHARPHYRRVLVANLESCDLRAMFSGQRYQAIVCADVLEHLSCPEQVLAACRDLLAPAGRLLLSVPNAGYAGLVAELLQGDFRYRPEGLLDRTHLRFFTRRSLLRFLKAQGWAVASWQTIVRRLPESEFGLAFDSLPPAVARYLIGRPDALSYQFIAAAYPRAASDAAAGAAREPLPAGAAEPAGAGALADPGDLDDPENLEDLEDPDDPAPQAAHFTAQLYLGQGGAYSEADKITAIGTIGAQRQLLRLAFEPRRAPLTGLRLDPADRAGFLHLYRIALRSADGQALWQWDAQRSPGSLLAGCAHQQIVWHAPLPAAGAATLLLLTGDEPWFELPLAPAQLGACAQHGALLEIELGWPMSADYLALSATVRPLHDRIAGLEAAVQQLQDLAARVQSRNAVLEDSLQAALQQRALLEQSCAQWQSDHGELALHLKRMENSTVFRVTRPLVHAKMRIDRLLGRSAQRRDRAATDDRPAPEAIAAPGNAVDIIVPVYRGLADTQRCIDSVLAANCRSAYRLIVVNDASPEPALSAWLRARAAQEARMQLLENPENLGFVGSVNRGMALSASNDVLLLNSDTEVAGDWLDRMRRAAYGDRRVATVTPLSNNATICSYPRFCLDNELPPGWSGARLDALCAQTHPGAVLDVPTGVGFCLYIRRDCLAQVGLFDERNFGKGYGEENDFCLRAAQAGWRNLLALDTFVLHRGGVSFGAQKSARERAAMDTLRRLHPRYEGAVAAFVQADPARPWRLALDVARITGAGLPVVLAVLHDRAGGTLRHVRELAAHLHGQALFLTLTPAPGRSVQLQLAGAGEGLRLVFKLASERQQLLQALRQLGVRHIHYHHLLGHDPWVTELPHLLRVRYDFSVHDYYSYCTHISLTGRDNRYAQDPGPGVCACCPAHARAPTGSGSVADWRQRNRHFLSAARNVLAPSHDSARRIAAFAPGARIRVAPHTDTGDGAQPQRAHAAADATAALPADALPGAAPDTSPVPSPPPLPATAPLKIAVLGALSAIKGADLLEAVALEAARRQAPVEFHLLGYGYRHLQTQPRAQLSVHGAYEDQDLPGLLRWLRPDLVWFPALWPETYSYTLSAALQAGLPVAAPDLGAFAERLAGRPWSWLLRWDMSPEQWLAALLDLRARHFVSAQPPQPAPPLPQALSACYGTALALPGAGGDQGQSPVWNYRQHYLQDLPEVAAPGALTQDFLRAHSAPAPHALGPRALLLTGLLRLRAQPLLRGLAQRIPQHWQTRVKSWLRA